MEKLKLIFFLLLLFAGCSVAEKGYQEHGFARVVSFSDGRISGQFYQEVTLTQREIDSLKNLPKEPFDDTLSFNDTVRIKAYSIRITGDTAYLIIK